MLVLMYWNVEVCEDVEVFKNMEVCEDTKMRRCEDTKTEDGRWKMEDF